MSEQRNLKVIGAGGIGTKLLPTLLQFVEYDQEREWRVTVIDGDIYKESNRSRQEFHRIGHKAEVSVERLSSECKRTTLRFRNEYVNPKSIEYLVEDGDVVMLCVDNHPTRGLVSEHCELLENVVLISGGNDYVDGNIQIHVRESGADKTLPIGNEFHPEIREPQGRRPDEIGCDELVVSEPQLAITNLAIASGMLNAFYAYLQGRVSYDEAYVDVMTNVVRPVRRMQ